MLEWLPLSLAIITQPANHPSAVPIDRKALITRHNITVKEFDTRSPLQIGNGEFAFGMDATGLQTFTPFNTLSQWGWHSSPLPHGEKITDFKGQEWDTNGRMVRYAMPDPERPGLSNWLSSNPRRVNLGRIGLILSKSDGSPVLPSDLKNIQQSLDMWSGVVVSRFEVEGSPVMVKTSCNPGSDSISVQIQSKLVHDGKIQVFFASPGDNPQYFANYVGDWSHPAQLKIEPSGQPNQTTLTRTLGEDRFDMAVRWEGNATLSNEPLREKTLRIVKAEYGAADRWIDVTPTVANAVKDNRLDLRINSQLGPDPYPGLGKRLRVTYTLGETAQMVEGSENDMLSISPKSEDHRVILTAKQSDQIAFTCTFSNKKLTQPLPQWGDVFAASRKHWPTFWKSGGAIDLSESKDPRWKELERRLVLSQYLMAVNEAGSLPPQESGLVNNGWYGRFHMEMYWWHAAHWATWNRWEILNKSIGIYSNLLPQAQETAQIQGYLGARWPKCVGPTGTEWPHEIHALLAWQQPHPIFLAELDYRAHPTPQTLKKWQPIVQATADFMASYAQWDEASDRYILGSPIHLASENTNPRKTMNPTFELGYWRFGLRIAQNWRTRMKLPAQSEWDKVLNKLSPLPIQEGKYVLHEGVENMWTAYNFEHPALTATFGMLPGDGVDRTVMHRTLDEIQSKWRFNHTWGWDFPMLAMCAARLGRPEDALRFLLDDYPGFQFDSKGLATGGPFPYFPSNGGLLYTVGMMAAGWDGAPKRNAPGFPENGMWKVRWEGLQPVP